ncbi:MAG: NnrS family protein [Rhodobacteraceae bacterium]|nr:NnrS family protein [Paracoccaceae bacterium]
MIRQQPKGERNSSDRVRAWAGPEILTYGYRPFFLLAGAWAALAMAFWVAMLAGRLTLWTRFDPVSWHAHEMLFGYLSAVMAGFLLTAVPNWTGRLPIVGWPLAGLVTVWLVGRIAVAFSASLSILVTATLDLAFLVVFALVIGREIMAGKNWRNLVVLAILILFIIANALFHASAARGEFAANGFGFRLGLASAVILISVVGGRIVPSFTRNWLVKQQVENRPAAIGTFDKLALLITLVSLALWAALPEHSTTAVLCAFAGCTNLIRLARWSGWHSRTEPLLWVLHVGFFFVPLGFLALAVSFWDAGLSPKIGAQHIWMAGAIGVMTLAVMTRASLGHAGRPLTATRGVTTVYLLVLASVVLRFIAALGASPEWILHLSAGAWIAGFTGFCWLYWPILTHRRP